MLKVWLGLRPSFTAMEDGAPRLIALHMAKGLLRGCQDVRTDSSSLNVLQAV